MNQKPRVINITWSTEDVRDLRPDLSDEQAWEVLTEALRRHDASIGVNHEILRTIAGNAFPPAPGPLKPGKRGGRVQFSDRSAAGTERYFRAGRIPVRIFWDEHGKAHADARLHPLASMRQSNIYIGSAQDDMTELSAEQYQEALVTAAAYLASENGQFHARQAQALEAGFPRASDRDTP